MLAVEAPPRQLLAVAAALLLALAAEPILARGVSLRDHHGADRWLATNDAAVSATAVKRGRAFGTLVRREEAPDLLASRDVDEPLVRSLSESEPSFLAEIEDEELSPSPSPSPSPLMLPGDFEKRPVEDSDTGSNRLPLGHSDMIYAVGLDDKAVYAQRASAMSPASNWTKLAAGKVLSVATEGDYLYVVKGDGRVYMQNLSAVSCDSSWGQPLSRGNARSLAVTHDQIYAVLEDKMLYKQDLPLDADHVHDWELVSQVLPNKDGRSVLIQGDTIYLVKEDLTAYRQPLKSMTEKSTWIPTSQAGVSSVAIVRDVFYGVMKDSRVHEQGSSRLDMLTSWDEAHCSAQGVESITSPWVREWQKSQPDVQPAYKVDHFRLQPGKKSTSIVNVTIINSDTAQVPNSSLENGGFTGKKRSTGLRIVSDKMEAKPGEKVIVPRNVSVVPSLSSPANMSARDEFFSVPSASVPVNASLGNRTFASIRYSVNQSSAGAFTPALPNSSYGKDTQPLQGSPVNGSSTMITSTVASAPDVVNSTIESKALEIEKILETLKKLLPAASSLNGSSTVASVPPMVNASTVASDPGMVNVTAENKARPSAGSSGDEPSARASMPAIVNATLANKTFFSAGSSGKDSSPTPSGTAGHAGSSVNGSAGASVPDAVNATSENKTFLSIGSSGSISSTVASIPPAVNAISGNKTSVSIASSVNDALTKAFGPALDNASLGNSTYLSAGSSANDSSAGGSVSNGASADNSSVDTVSSGNLSSAGASTDASSDKSAAVAPAATESTPSPTTSTPAPAPGPPILPSIVNGTLDLEMLQEPADFLKNLHTVEAVKEGLALAAVCGAYHVEMLGTTKSNVSRMRHLGGRDRVMNTLEVHFRVPVALGITGFKLIQVIANSSLTKVGARIRAKLRQSGVADEVFVFGLTAEVNMTGATPPNPWVFPPVQTRLSATGVDSGSSGIDITTFTTTTGGFGNLKVKFANDPYNTDLDDPVEDADPTTTVIQSMWGPPPIPAAEVPGEQQIVKGTLQFLSSSAEEVVNSRDAQRVVRQELATAASVNLDDVTATFGYTVQASLLVAESLHEARRLWTPGYVDCEYSITVEGNHTASGIKQALTAADHDEMATHLQAGFLTAGLISLSINVTGFTHEIRTIELIGPKANLTGLENGTDSLPNLNMTDGNLSMDVEENSTNTSKMPKASGLWAVPSHDANAALDDSIIRIDKIRTEEEAKSVARSCSAIAFIVMLPVIAAS